MLLRTRNTLESIEANSERLGRAGDQLVSSMEDEVHRIGRAADTVNASVAQASAVIDDTLDHIRVAADAHRSAMAAVESLVWGVVTAVVVWYAFDVARDVIGHFRQS